MKQLRIFHSNIFGTPWVDYMKLQISEEEITFLTGCDDHTDDKVVLDKLFHPNLKLLIVTEGSKGCRYYTKVTLLIIIA